MDVVVFRYGPRNPAATQPARGLKENGAKQVGVPSESSMKSGNEVKQDGCFPVGRSEPVEDLIDKLLLLAYHTPSSQSIYPLYFEARRSN